MNVRSTSNNLLILAFLSPSPVDTFYHQWYERCMTNLQGVGDGVAVQHQRHWDSRPTTLPLQG